MQAWKEILLDRRIHLCAWPWWLTFGSMRMAWSLRKVQRKRARFWMKFCSSSCPFLNASLMLVTRGSICTQVPQHSATQRANKMGLACVCVCVCVWERDYTCLSCVMTRVNMITNCSEYCVLVEAVWMPAVTHAHAHTHKQTVREWMHVHV